MESFVRHANETYPALSLLVTAPEALAIADHLKHRSLRAKPIWLIGSMGLEIKTLSGIKRVFHGGIFVEPYMPELKEFKSYFINSLQVSRD